jgi:hypothetical protein
LPVEVIVCPTSGEPNGCDEFTQSEIECSSREEAGLFIKTCSTEKNYLKAGSTIDCDRHELHLQKKWKEYFEVTEIPSTCS